MKPAVCPGIWVWFNSEIIFSKIKLIISPHWVSPSWITNSIGNRHSPSSFPINYNSTFGILLSLNRKKAKANSEHCLCTIIYSAFVYPSTTYSFFFLISPSWRKVKIFVITLCVLFFCVLAWQIKHTNKKLLSIAGSDKKTLKEREVMSLAVPAAKLEIV